MALGDIYQVTMIGTLQGMTIENVLHYRVRADADASAFATGIEIFANTTFMPAMATVQSSNFNWSAVRVQRIWPIPVLMAVEYPEGIAGALSGTALPAEVALVITKQSILGGRANRGRLYLAGVPGDNVDVTSGRFSSGVVIDAQTAAATLYQTINSSPSGGVLEPVIYHRVTHTATDLVNAVARDVPRAQRRRQVGRGI